jgi:GNAT superfamily N-acetyltransferase
MIIDRPTKSQTPELCSLWCEAFGDTEEFFGIFQRTAYSEERCRCLTLDGSVAAALYWFDCEYEGKPLAYLYAIATKKAFRGKGLCAALMEDTHRHLKELGYIGAILSPAEPSLYGFYARFGYKTATYIRTFSADSNGSMPLRRISAEEYGAIRRRFLPEDAVLQEDASLRFLESDTELYTGDGVLLAARRNGETLFSPEFLGDTKKAAAVLGTLGKESGIFRTVGDETPLTMFLSFSDIETPKYFGLVFD